MGNPYTTVTVTSYNSNPPPDDGSEVAGNRVQWSTHKTKIGDPLKTAIEAVNTNVNTAIAKLVGGAGITSTATDYTVTAADQSKLIKVTASATITTPDATVVGSPFVFGVLNRHSGNITLDGSGSQTVDGAASIVIPSGFGVLFFTDGSNWFTTGQNFVTAQPVASGFKNLVIKNNASTPTTSIDVDADAVTVETSTGKAYRLNSVNLTIDCTTTGANALDTGGLANSKWYYVFVIYNPTTDTVAGLMSLSATAPTLPSGYTAKARFGAIPTGGSATFFGVLQKGRKSQYVVGLGATTAPSLVRINGPQGTYDVTSPTLTSVSIAGDGFPAPLTAVSVRLIATTGYKSAGTGGILVAPNSSWGGANNGPDGTNGVAWPIHNNADVTIMADIMLESSAVYWAAESNQAAIACLGWEDNI